MEPSTTQIRERSSKRWQGGATRIPGGARIKVACSYRGTCAGQQEPVCCSRRSCPPRRRRYSVASLERATHSGVVLGQHAYRYRPPIAVTLAPLVSIGVPTYERVATLERAIASALAQTHSQLEVIVSDDASRDGTEAFCRAVAARDPRFRYIRHEQHIGPTANFNALFGAWRGDYVLLLADDDWFDSDYVERCLALLRSDPDVALVSGRARYVRDGAFVHNGVVHQHCQPDPVARVRSYLSAVDDNGVLYGLMPRAVLEQARPLPNVLGNDWLHVARIACQGPIRMLEDVHVHRELGGTSADVGKILAIFGCPRWQARVPQLVIAWHLLRDIAWNHPVYRGLGRRRRLTLGFAGAVVSIRWRALAWHLFMPSVANLGRRPCGRPLWMVFDRLARALGAGRRP